MCDSLGGVVELFEASYWHEQAHDVEYRVNFLKLLYCYQIRCCFHSIHVESITQRPSFDSST